MYDIYHMTNYEVGKHVFSVIAARMPRVPPGTLGQLHGVFDASHRASLRTKPDEEYTATPVQYATTM